MTGFGWKGGIGTSSRITNTPEGEYTIGCLTLTNTGDPRDLRLDGIPVGRHILPPNFETDEYNPNQSKSSDEPPGSIMIIIATDAPLSSRQLNRLAKRVGLGLGLSGGIASHGSGDFVIAFSNAEYNKSKNKNAKYDHMQLTEDNLNNLFRGVIETTNESIINSILKAETVTGINGNTRHAIPIDKLVPILEQSRATKNKDK